MRHRHVKLVSTTDVNADPPAGVSVENCEREPIHIPNAIQPHGALVAFDPVTFAIRCASANLGEWLPVGSLPLRERSLRELLDAASWDRIERALRTHGAAGIRHEIMPLRAAAQQDGGAGFEGTIHRHRGQCILEIERAAATPFNGLQVHSDIMAALRSAADFDELLVRTARRVKRFTGLDRVMVYRFDRDWHGEVVAEAREPDMASFIGLHYPASDIPAQARELYRTNLVRFISDVGYVPVPIEHSAEPLDMSHSVLRSVSPIHREYLRNMGVGATLTISLVIDGQLWGLIACHHRGPVSLSPQMRQTCNALSLSASYLFGWHLQRMRSEAASQAAKSQAGVIKNFNQVEVPLADVIENSSTAMLQLVGATGGAFWHRGEFLPFGHWPTGDYGAELRGFAQRRLASTDVDIQSFESIELDRACTPEEQRMACGGLLLRLGEFSNSGVFWIRPEYRREVLWGGDPDKPYALMLDASGQPKLGPRASFEQWSTLVRGHCRPWTDLDLDAARSLLQLRQMLAVRDSLTETQVSDRRFRALVNLQSDAYWQVDRAGSLLALSKPLPIRVESADVRSLPDLLAQHCTEASVQALRQALQRGEAFRELRIASRSHEPGQEFELVFSGDALRDHQLQVIGFHGTITDVTPAVRADREMRQRQAAELANQTKSRFLSQVSHELRTPLNAVLGHAQLLLQDDSTSPGQRVHAQNIQKAGQWLLAMISDLLDVARIEAGRLELDLQNLSVVPVIENAFNTLRTQADALGVTIHFDPPLENVIVYADPTRLGQVLLNLLGNAIKYNRPGGRVEVSVNRQSAGRFGIAVRDTGPGLGPDQLSQLFQPFNRLGHEGSRTPGTGIGLVIARQLVEAMGGAIDVRSELGIGSCFTVIVDKGSDNLLRADSCPPAPDAEKVNRRLAQLAPLPQAIPTDPLPTVLYVEDEPTNVVLMQAVVDSIGTARMVHAASAEEGLALAQERAASVILIDLNLPGHDGAWLLSAIRQVPSLANAHCVAVTADAMRETLQHVRELGFDQCWTKPIDLRWTARALQVALAISREPHRPVLSFDDPHALEALAKGPDIWLDTLQFGVVRLDAELRATAYNLRESLCTGYEPAAVVGVPFFKDIAPYMDNPLVAGRLAQAGPLDVTMDFTFRVRQRREPVRLRLLADPKVVQRYLLIDHLG